MEGFLCPRNAMICGLWSMKQGSRVKAGLLVPDQTSAPLCVSQSSPPPRLSFLLPILVPEPGSSMSTELQAHLSSRVPMAHLSVQCDLRECDKRTAQLQAGLPQLVTLSNARHDGG